MFSLTVCIAVLGNSCFNDWNMLTWSWFRGNNAVECSILILSENLLINLAYYENMPTTFFNSLVFVGTGRLSNGSR